MARLPELRNVELNAVLDYFHQTRNPAAAWHVFSLCQKSGTPVPSSVMAEVTRFADGIAAETAKSIDASTDAGVRHFRGAEIYELWRNGADNPIGAMQSQWHDWKIFSRVQTLVDEGMSARRARSVVASQPDVMRGVDTIKNIWDRYKSPADKRRTIR